MVSAGSVTVCTASNREAGAGPIPSPALHKLLLRPIPATVAKELIVCNHYLHSFPGGTKFTFGLFVGSRLMGSVTLGAGPYLAHQLVDGASPEDCMGLTRLWLSDELPGNSESRVLGVVIRSLKRNTHLKFLVAYSDPAAGHLGTIYQATNWVYTGMSSGTPLYDIGDGIPRHSRSLAHEYGSHSIRYFAANCVSVKLLPQAAKHRYLYFLDPQWKYRLRVPVLPYPKSENAHEDD